MSKGVVEFIAGAALIAGAFLLPGSTILGSALLFTVAQDALLVAGARLVAQATLAQHVSQLRVNGVSTSAGLPTVYGDTIVGLRLVDVRQDPSDKNLLYIVGALCHGPIDAIQEIWFDERLAFDKDGNVQLGAAKLASVFPVSWTPFAWIWKHLGGTSDPVDSTLHSVFPSQWPTTSTGKGVAYLVLKLKYDKDLFPNGLPNITVRVRGRTVFDPRTSTTGWSDNPILCARDYLTNPVYGFGADASEIDDTSVSDLANVCDELVSTPRGDQPRFRCNGALDTTRELLENAAQLLSSCRGVLLYQSGQFRPHIARVVTASGITLDQSTILGDWEFQTPTARQAYNQVVCRFVNLGLVQPPSAGDLEILSDGSDTRQVTITYLDPSGVQHLITKTLTSTTAVACGITCQTVQKIALSTTSTTRTVTVRAAASSLSGPMRIATLLPLASGLDNTGHQVSEVQWPGPNDTNAFLADDNGFWNVLTVDLPFTIDYWMAQQIAMVLLKESRQSLAVQVTCTEAALQARIGDVVAVTHPTPAWTAKLFWVAALAIQEDGTVRVALREYEPTAYDYVTSTDADSIPDTGLPDPFSIAAVTGLTLTATNAEALIRTDGFYVPRIKVEWTASTDPYIDHYEIQAKRDSDADWDSWGDAQVDDVVFYVAPVTDELWDVRIRAVNHLGVVSDWTSASVTVTVSAVPYLLAGPVITGTGEAGAGPTTYPAITFQETDLAAPNGRWWLALFGDTLHLQKNTAAAGDFSTTLDVLALSGTAATLALPLTLAAATDGPGPLFLRRHSATGRIELDLLDEAGATQWRVGATGAGSLQFNVFDGTTNVLTMVHGAAGAITFDTARPVTMGALTAPTLSLGTAPYAASGQLRLPNNSALRARNAANTADLELILAASDNTLRVLQMARFATAAFYPEADGGADLGISAAHRWRTGYFSNVTIGAGAAAAITIDGVDIAQSSLASNVALFENGGALSFTARAGFTFYVDGDDNNAGLSNAFVVLGGKGDGTGFNTLLNVKQDYTIQFGLAGVFDTSTAPGVGNVWRYDGAHWVPVTLNFSFTAGDVAAAAFSDGTTAAYVNDGRTLSGTIGSTPSAPGVTAGYKSVIVNLGGVPPANVAWEIRWSTDSGSTWSDAAGDVIATTGDQVQHAHLDPTKTYLYQVRKHGSTTGSWSASSAGVTPSNQARVDPFSVIVAGQIATTDLAAISANLGTITAGQMHDSSNTYGILLSGSVPGSWRTYLDLVDGVFVVSDGTHTRAELGLIGAHYGVQFADGSGNLLLDTANATGVLKTRVGQSTTLAPLSHVFYGQGAYSTTSAPSTAVLTGGFATIPANALATNGDMIRIVVSGRFSSTAAGDFPSMYFGTTVTSTPTAKIWWSGWTDGTSSVGTNVTCASWVIEALIVRTGASAGQVMAYMFNSTGTTVAQYQNYTLALSWASDQHVVLHTNRSTSGGGTAFVDAVIMELLTAS